MTKLPRRAVLKGVAGVAAASMLAPVSSLGQQSGATNSNNVAQKPQLPAGCFANLNQPQRHRYTGLNDLAGRRRFPFLDTRQIRQIEGVELRFHPAQKHGDPVMVADPRHETGTCLYGTVRAPPT